MDQLVASVLLVFQGRALYRIDNLDVPENTHWNCGAAMREMQCEQKVEQVAAHMVCPDWAIS